METKRVLIAYGFGDCNAVRGPRKNIAAKAASRRAVKKAAKRYDRIFERRLANDQLGGVAC